jgi:hypothetical protein
MPRSKFEANADGDAATTVNAATTRRTTTVGLRRRSDIVLINLNLKQRHRMTLVSYRLGVGGHETDVGDAVAEIQASRRSRRAAGTAESPILQSYLGLLFANPPFLWVSRETWSIVVAYHSAGCFSGRPDVITIPSKTCRRCLRYRARRVIRWIAQFIGYPSDAGGCLEHQRRHRVRLAAP